MGVAAIIRRRFPAGLALLSVAGFLSGAWGCHSVQIGPIPKVIVLGVDGMDPAFIERHWSALPHVTRLRDYGSFQRLATTTPPQSPVAWSTFITGLAPAQHGIFDFVHRDARTLQPYSSMSRNEEPRWKLPLGPYILPLSASHVVSLRKGTPFWQVLADRGVPVTVVRMPTNYPPTGAGYQLSGMGTPDLEGTLGTFSFFTDDPAESSRAVTGGRVVRIDLKDGHVVLPLAGPPNSLRRNRDSTFANLAVDVDADASVARLKIEEDVAVVRQGEWSDWLSASFPLLPHVATVRGTFRVFAKQLHPQLELYISPINIDPLSPALPISSPPSWSAAIVHEVGRFYTMGTPEDTSALRQGVFDLPEFQAQTRLVFEEERLLLRYSIEHYRNGLLFFYFSTIDQNSHILWGKHEAELLEVYKAIDSCIGEVQQAEPDAQLIVMSDHGFTTFDRAVNLNTWLQHHGFLNLLDEPGDTVTLDSIKWSSTVSYALGLNGLYLNRSGREAHGIVASKQIRALTANLRNQLVSWRDPEDGKPVVEAVYETNALEGNAAVAPDLIVGYAPGYRASWQTGVGITPTEEIEDNHDAWIGDHCINPVDVPGVLFRNSRESLVAPGLQDVTALILNLFGVPRQ